MRGLARAGALALVVGLGAGPSAARAQDEEPPPWESGEVPGEAPWEAGAPLPEDEEEEPPPEPEEGAEAEGTPAEEPEPREVEIPPPGVDTERPYRVHTREMETTPVDELGITEREEDGTTWTVIPFDGRGPVVYGGLGYEAGSGIGHLVIEAAGGWTVWGEWEALLAKGEKPRLEGTVTNLLLSVVGAPRVTDGSVPSWLTIGVRAQQVVAFGEHLFSAHFGLGGRKDLGTGLGGVDLVFGVAYAYSLPPYAIPVQFELVRHYSGVHQTKEWGARISVGWPFWFSL